MQYSFFGKNQKNEDIEKKIDKEVKEIINTKKLMLRKMWPTMFPFDRLDKSASLTI